MVKPGREAGSRAPRLFLIGEDPGVTEAVRRRLEAAGYGVEIASTVAEGLAPAPRVAYAGVELDRIEHRAWYLGRPLDLTPTEYRVLEQLVLHAGGVASRRELLEVVWGLGSAPVSNAVDVHVSHLRRKLEADGRPRIVFTVRGRGFFLREPEVLGRSG